ncbi:lipase family protein [Paenibacillus glacialis]|uniref:triacylglycerol lipase n=1 Tax=Paenibacillus glacialis TaxID=494026 RepID=A0A168KQE2_9BACL|nr:hypothetical protein PGLA_13325 [Paenibacillus glacialis]
MTYINDKTYWDISSEVYNRDITPESKVKVPPGWKVVEPDGAMLHDTNGSGFDANVFYNEKTNQVIIGYRGTEPMDRPFWSKMMDWGTDASDVVLSRTKNLEKVHLNYEKNKDEIASLPFQSQIAYHQAEARYQSNQFTQAENLYKKVKEQYPNAEISTTGHSLGGAEAEYVAVRNGLPSVSYNAPSIFNMLSDDLQKKSKAGEFNNTNIAYVHPGDTVGSGPGTSSGNPHVGATVFINSTFKDANKSEFTMNIPVSIPIKRSNPFEQFIMGNKWTPIQYVPLTIPLGQQSIVMKLYNSLFGGEKTHALEHFSFDGHGNLNNRLFGLDGQAIEGNPRVSAYDKMMAARAELKEAMGDLVERYGSNMGIFGQMAAAGLGVTIRGAGSKGGGTIQLTTEELRQAARQMKASLRGFSNDTKNTIQLFQTHIATSKSQSLAPIAHNATATLDRINRWYQESISEIADYIDRKEQIFTAADK